MKYISNDPTPNVRVKSAIAYLEPLIDADPDSQEFQDGLDGAIAQLRPLQFSPTQSAANSTTGEEKPTFWSWVFRLFWV